MRVLLLAMTSLLVGIPVAQAEWCNWGWSGPKVFSCNGKKYVYGTAACDSGLYRDIFCREKFADDGRACSDDNDEETIACYNKAIAPKSKSKTEGPDSCNWGGAGPKVILCKGKRFVYGVAACRSKVYWNIFCQEELSQNGKACAEDESEITMQCYKAFMKQNPPSYGMGDRSGISGTSSNTGEAK